MNQFIVYCTIAIVICGVQGEESPAIEIELKKPTILIVTLFRNKAHTLPLFFTYLEQLDYPKDRIGLWFQSDHNEDRTIEIVQTWLNSNAELYNNVRFEHQNNPKRRSNETSPTHWPEERHLAVIKMKEEALNYARKSWVDYVFFLDADVFLIERQTLNHLIALELSVVAPILASDGLYSNFWCGMTPEFYYQRTTEYKEIYNFEKRGTYSVPMVHSAVFINLRHSLTDHLTFNRDNLQKLYKTKNLLMPDHVPIDDIIVFTLSANVTGISVKITNQELYGFIMVPLEQDEPLSSDIDQLTNIKIHIINDVTTDGIIITSNLLKFVKPIEMNTLTLSKIYMINLVRRPERRRKMQQSFNELGLIVDDYPAVDGNELNDAILDEIGIKSLNGYADPYHNRPMTTGEIGCFLSHYHIWQTMVDNDLKEVLILEDDIRFEPYFMERAKNIIQEAREIGGWDLIYLGRKRLEHQDEQWVGNSKRLVHAGYSYWTLGYILTLIGAQKLLDAKPLEKLLPVDEFLPIMFDKHLNATWKNAFETRNLIAWSAAPLILFPTHYTGEHGYISDTEDSALINSNFDFEGGKKEKKGNREIFNGTDSDAIVSPELSNAAAAELDANNSLHSEL